MKIKTPQQGIERAFGDGNEAVCYGEYDEEVSFNRFDNFDYFVLNTDDFREFAPKGSIIQVWMDGGPWEKTDLFLVAGNNRLEIRPYAKSKGIQVLGKITEVHYRPGKPFRNVDL